MKKLLLILILATSSAFAGTWTQQRIGNFDYYTDSNGQSYTGQQIGSFYYLNGPNGYESTGQRIGNFYYWNDNR